MKEGNHVPTRGYTEAGTAKRLSEVLTIRGERITGRLEGHEGKSIEGLAHPGEPQFDRKEA